MLNLEHHSPDPRTDFIGQVICGDNLEILSRLDDRQVDLVYVDPPFGTGSARRGRGARFADPLTDPEALTRWLEPRFEHCRRVLTRTGSLFVHLDYRTVHYVKVALDRLFGRSRFVNEIIWCYSVGGKSSRRFARKHDTILWYARTADYAFYPDRVRVPRKPNSHMRVVIDENGEPVQEKTDRKTGVVYRYPVNRGKVPEDWWTDVETLNRGDAERTGYPTQKPSRLLERIILGCTQPGDLVADFFCGSGTTLVAAQTLERRWLGVDVSEEACSVARRRLGDD